MMQLARVPGYCCCFVLMQSDRIYINLDSRFRNTINYGMETQSDGTKKIFRDYYLYQYKASGGTICFS